MFSFQGLMIVKDNQFMQVWKPLKGMTSKVSQNGIGKSLDEQRSPLANIQNIVRALKQGMHQVRMQLAKHLPT